MNPTVAIALAVIGIVVLSYVIRYVIRTIFNKAGDALQNKLAEKKNKESDGKEENLSDRYK
jgi:hypothetical protein